MAKALPRNADLADQLDLLADISEILGEESFKIIAYRRAATRIRETPSPVAELALSGRATDLPGVGKTIEQKVVEVVEEGEMKALAKRRGQVPAGEVEFLRLPGVGPKTAARIWSELGITTLDGLQTAAEEGRLRGLSGLGQKSEEKILKSLAEGAGRKPTREDRGLLGAGLPAVMRVVEELAAHPAATAVSEFERDFEPEIAHDGADDRTFEQTRALAGARDDIDELIAVDDTSETIDHGEPIAIAIERDTGGGTHAWNRELQQAR